MTLPMSEPSPPEEPPHSLSGSTALPAKKKQKRRSMTQMPFVSQRYTYRVLQTIQMKLILLWVWAERAFLGRAKTPLKFKYEIQTG